MEFFLDQSVEFKTFSKLHFYSVIIPAVLAALLVFTVRKYFDLSKRHYIVFFISLLPAFCVILRIGILMADGTFTFREELPLHLCRLLALLYPFIIWYQAVKWINAFYFIVFAGILQAVLTPDLQYGPMHYSYFLYFTLHNVLLFMPFLTVFLLKYTPDFKGLKLAFISINVYMIFTMIINYLLGSNYFYTLRKPPGASLLDVMGPWPVYIITGEILALLLFILAWLPFRSKKV